MCYTCASIPYITSHIHSIIITIVCIAQPDTVLTYTIASIQYMVLHILVHQLTYNPGPGHAYGVT